MNAYTITRNAQAVARFSEWGCLLLGGSEDRSNGRLHSLSYSHDCGQGEARGNGYREGYGDGHGGRPGEAHGNGYGFGYRNGNGSARGRGTGLDDYK